jgi:hypothetical protein
MRPTEGPGSPVSGSGRTRAACDRQYRDPSGLAPQSDEGRRFFAHAAECVYCGTRLLEARQASAALAPIAVSTLSPARVARLQERMYEVLDGPAPGPAAAWPRVLARLMPLVACGVAGYLLAVWQPSSKPAPDARPAEVAVRPAAGAPASRVVEAKAAPARLALEDGSVALFARGGAGVAEAGDATIKVSRGRALLVVKPREKGRRFEVVTPEARVTVLGTVFSVERTGETTHVEVHEGRVWVAAQRGDAGRVLVAGERVRLGGDGVLANDGKARTLDVARADELRGAAASADESALQRTAERDGLLETPPVVAPAPTQPARERVRPREIVKPDAEAELRRADEERKRGAFAAAVKRYRAVQKSGEEPWAKLALASLADLARNAPGAGLDENALLGELARRYPGDPLGRLARERLDAPPGTGGSRAPVEELAP